MTVESRIYIHSLTVHKLAFSEVRQETVARLHSLRCVKYALKGEITCYINTCMHFFPS